MATQLGLDSKFYYDVSGVGGSSWTELGLIESVSITRTKAQGEVRNRTLAFAGVHVGRASYSVTVTITRSNDNATFEAMRDAWSNGTMIGIAMADGAIATSGTKSFQSDAYVTDFNEEQPLEEPETAEFTIVPAADASTAPNEAQTV